MRVAPFRVMLLRRVLLVWVSCVAPCAAAAAELERETVIAYERYTEGLARVFTLETSGGESGLARISPQALARLRSGETLAKPGHDDGILEVSGGLIHHWRGAVFIPDVSLERVLATAQDYGSYARVYDWVIRSTLLRQVNEPAAQRDRFWTFLRIERSASVVTSTVDLWTEIEYRYPRHDLATAVSNTDCIRQVEDPGEPDERRLEAGKGSGYLWRADTYASYLERDGGVYVDLQTVGLSRGFPPLLGWIIEPIARRLGRGSAEESLKQLREAVARTASRPPERSKSPEAVEPSSSLTPTPWCGARRPTRYFDQGLRLYYGFNHAESIRSFEEATRQDPDCAMCYWGIALAHRSPTSTRRWSARPRLPAYEGHPGAQPQRPRRFLASPVCRAAGGPISFGAA